MITKKYILIYIEMSLIKQKTINKLLINQVNEVKHIIFSFSDEYKFKFDNIY